MNRPSYTISIAAELTGLHPQTLRMYEARGLVRPRRTPGGTRRYSEGDLERLRRIMQLTNGGRLNLAGAERVLELEARLQGLAERVVELEARLEDASRERRREIEQVHKSYRRDLVLYVKPSTSVRSWTFRN